MSDSIKDAVAKYEDLLKLPDHVVGEIVGGELFVSPRPASPHARVTSALGGELVGPFDRGRGGPGGWWILDEPELHFDENVLVPDLAGWRRERMPRIPNVAAFQLAPDWVCEVVSPSSAHFDRVRKMPVYAANDVRNLWVIDPLARILEVFRLSGGVWVLVLSGGGEEVVRAEPFDAIEVDLSGLWI